MSQTEGGYKIRKANACKPYPEPCPKGSWDHLLWMVELKNSRLICFILCILLLCLHIGLCTPFVLEPIEIRRGHQIPWQWRFKDYESPRALGARPESSARTSALNHSAINHCVNANLLVLTMSCVTKGIVLMLCPCARKHRPNVHRERDSNVSGFPFSVSK